MRSVHEKAYSLTKFPNSIAHSADQGRLRYAELEIMSTVSKISATEHKLKLLSGNITLIIATCNESSFIKNNSVTRPKNVSK